MHNLLCDDLCKILLFRSRLCFEAVDLVYATAQTSDDRMKQEGINVRPTTPKFAFRLVEEVGQSGEEQCEAEG